MVLVVAAEPLHGAPHLDVARPSVERQQEDDQQRGGRLDQRVCKVQPRHPRAAVVTHVQRLLQIG